MNSEDDGDLTRREFVKRAGLLTGAIGIGIPVFGEQDQVGVHEAGIRPGVTIPVELTVNDERHTLSIDPRVSLLDLLREQLALTGTKKGCDHGQCGACTVLSNGRRINSCLSLAVSHQGDEITTIEGIATGQELHPVQTAFVECDGFQCGYCTPGQICSAVGLLNEAGHEGYPELTDDAIRERMSGNICRCGAYPRHCAGDSERVSPEREALERWRRQMTPFGYERSYQTEAAIHAASSSRDTKFLAGGTNLVDLMKNGVELPARIIDINRLPLTAIEELPNGGLRLGALARNSDTANHPLVRQKYPLLAQAILSGASPQLRNMATNGGNLLQRTRCYYFTDAGFPQCNKRAPGSGCGALDGFNRIHAIFGASKQCIAIHPSDMCVALAALDATVRTLGTKGERTISITDFHRLPGSTPHLDTNLEPHELIVSIDLPPNRFGAHLQYLKIRDRASYSFALVSVAAGLVLDGDRILDARIALGGVAHKPWRAKEAEKELVGHRVGTALFQKAARKAVKGAKTYPHNAFKVEMAEQAMVRALNVAGGVA